MPDERAAADRLVAFWDALVLDQPTDGFDVDEEVAASLERFQQVGAAAPTTARERVWEALQPELASSEQHGTASTSATPNWWLATSRSGAAASLPRRERNWPRWTLAHLATAALLLITLGLGYLTLVSGRLGNDRPDSPPAAIEAPAPESTFEPLFTMTMPADEVPTAGVLRFDFWRLSLDPGGSAPMSREGQACCDGPQLTHVLQGELTVRVEGPLRVFRGAEGVPDGADVAPGTELVVRPGDTVVHDSSVPATYTNHGAVPVQLVNGALSARTTPDPWSADMGYLDGTKEHLSGPLPAGPVALTLLRAVLPPNGEFPAPPDGGRVLEVGAVGDAAIGTRGDSSLFNINDKAETIYILVLEPEGALTLTP